MLVTYPYRNNLSAYVAGFVDVEGSGTRDGLPQCRWRTSRPYHSAGGRDKIRPTDTPPARIREKTRPRGSALPGTGPGISPASRCHGLGDEGRPVAHAPCGLMHAATGCAQALTGRTVVGHAGPVCPGLQTLPLRAAFAPTGAFGSACFVVCACRRVSRELPPHGTVIHVVHHMSSTHSLVCT